MLNSPYSVNWIVAERTGFSSILIGCCRTLSDYFMWTVLRRLVPFLSRPFREAETKYKRLTSHIKAEPARWLTCITTTNYHRGLTFATGSLYIEKAFDKKMIPLVCAKHNFVWVQLTVTHVFQYLKFEFCCIWVCQRNPDHCKENYTE